MRKQDCRCRKGNSRLWQHFSGCLFTFLCVTSFPRGFFEAVAQVQWGRGISIVLPAVLSRSLQNRQMLIEHSLHSLPGSSLTQEEGAHQSGASGGSGSMVIGDVGRNALPGYSVIAKRAVTNVAFSVPFCDLVYERFCEVIILFVSSVRKPRAPCWPPERTVRLLRTEATAASSAVLCFAQWCLALHCTNE